MERSICERVTPNIADEVLISHLDRPPSVQPPPRRLNSHRLRRSSRPVDRAAILTDYAHQSPAVSSLSDTRPQGPGTVLCSPLYMTFSADPDPGAGTPSGACRPSGIWIDSWRPCARALVRGCSSPEHTLLVPCQARDYDPELVARFADPLMHLSECILPCLSTPFLVNGRELGAITGESFWTVAWPSSSGSRAYLSLPPRG